MPVIACGSGTMKTKIIDMKTIRIIFRGILKLRVKIIQTKAEGKN